MRGKRIIISGLVSSKVNLDEILSSVRAQIKLLDGIIVGDFVQRRGVSRSKKPGDSKTYISLGKAEELKVCPSNEISKIG